MNFLKEVLEHNRTFIKGHKKKGPLPKVSKIPSKEVVILTCMDTRLIGFLEDALGKTRGEFQVIKNAGGIVSHPFGGVMRSLVIAIYALGVSEIAVIAHEDCGVCNLDAHTIEKKIIDAGISADVLRGIESTGTNLHHWLGGFDNTYESVKQATEQIRLHPLIPDQFPVHGLIIDPETGELELVVDGYDVTHLKSYEEYRKETDVKGSVLGYNK